MNAFAMFAAQHAELLNHRRSAPPPPATVRHHLTRPDTPSEIAVLEYITATPCVDAGTVARALRIDPESVYPIMQRLKRNGQIVSTGRIGNGNRWRAIC